MEPLRVAVIGAGRRGLVHAERLKKCHRTRLITVCDKITERAEAACEKFGTPLCTDVDEMLARDEVEAVLVVTQTPGHAPLSVRCLEAGRHVLCEKPMADTIEAAREMLRVARDTGLAAAIGFQRRFLPFNWTLKKVAAEMEPLQVLLTGQRGIFMQKYLRYGSAYGSMDAACHQIDLVNWFMGRRPRSVCSTLRCGTFTPTDAIDVVSLQVDYGDSDDPAVANILASMGGCGLQDACHLVGARGNAQQAGEDGIQITAVEFSEEAGQEQERQVVSTRTEPCEPLPGEDPTMALHYKFAAYAQGLAGAQEAGVATFQDGLDALLVAEATLLSHREARKVDLGEFASP